MNSAPDAIELVAREICQQRSYEFLGALGRGAFKSAYLIGVGDNRFALKVASLRAGHDRLAREAEALRGCTHIGIARLSETFLFSFNGENYWVVQEEYLPGGTLERRTYAQALQRGEILQLGRSLAEVLEHLDERRLVHRDIKPANILFREDGSAVLTDFGVVRMLDEPSLTHTFLGAGPGTPAYASPEQLNNERALIDWRTDQFGLALVLGECLLERNPFQESGMTLHDAIAAVAAKQELGEATRRELEAAGLDCLVRALKPWPVDRYRRPSQLIAALSTS